MNGNINKNKLSFKSISQFQINEKSYQLRTDGRTYPNYRNIMFDKNDKIHKSEDQLIK